MVTQVLTQDVETPKMTEGNAAGPIITTKVSQGAPTIISKRMIESHERIDQVEDLLGALRFSYGPFTF